MQKCLHWKYVFLLLLCLLGSLPLAKHMIFPVSEMGDNLLRNWRLLSVICLSSRKTNINYEAGDKYSRLVYCVG